MEEDIKKIENCIQNWKSKPNIMIKQEQFELIHILEKCIDRLKEDEAEKKEVINYLKEEISVMGRGKGMFVVKTALGAVLEKIEKGEKNKLK